MDAETDKLVDDCEQSWEKKTITIPNVVLDDAPLKELIVKAHNILASESHETLDALVCRLADAIPEGVTESNFPTAKPLAGACKRWFTNVEKLRSGLKRPALDWGKAVDTAAKEWVARAEPTLRPIIDAVKAIDDRKKAEKIAAEAAEQKRIADEEAARILAVQEAERTRLKAEQDAERAKVAAAAEANRVEAERLAAERKEMDELKAWLAEREKIVVSKEDAKKIVEAPDGKAVSLPPDPLPIIQALEEHLGATMVHMPDDLPAVVPDPLPRDPDLVDAGWPPTVIPDIGGPRSSGPAVGQAPDAEAFEWPAFTPDSVIVNNDWPPKVPPGFAGPAPISMASLDTAEGRESAKITNDELQRIMLDADASAEHSKAGVEVHEAGDQQKVRDFGMAIKVFVDGLKRPLLVKHEARQAVELAVFDIYGVANGLQEWGM